MEECNSDIVRSNMKCPKCRSEMAKKKESEHNYYYECPKCHTRIGKKD